MSNPLSIQIFGGAAVGGYEDDPDIRFETTDKTGIMCATAVMSRKIHCLRKHAEAIKQNASFPGQIIEIKGRNYGAGWAASDVVISNDGPEWAIVSFSARREGVTPFEFNLPPRLSCITESGSAAIWYTPTTGEPVQMAVFNSGTGENRYGWRVDYVEDSKFTYGNSTTWWKSVNLSSCKVYLENVLQFSVDAISALTNLSRPIAGNEEWIEKWKFFDTEEAAQDAGDAALVTWLETLNEQVDERVDYDRHSTGVFLSGPRWIDVDNATATAVYKVREGVFDGITGAHISAWTYTLSVPVVRLEANIDEYLKEFSKGLHWEAQNDTLESSPTFEHLFYKLVFAGTTLLAIDVTAAEVAAGGS